MDSAGAPEAGALLATVAGHHVPPVRVVDEVAPRPVCTVARDPVLLTELGLVLVVSHHVLLQSEDHEDLEDCQTQETHPQFVLAVSKLTELSVQAASFLLEVTADFGLESDLVEILENKNKVQ